MAEGPLVIHSLEDLERVLLTHPEWRERLRSLLLPTELLEFPARFSEAWTRTQETLRQTSEQIAQLTQRMERVEAQIEALTQRVNDLTQRMERVEAQIEALTQRGKRPHPAHGTRGSPNRSPHPASKRPHPAHGTRRSPN
ncbi:MAG: hypothetical protein KatS3mg026_1285 [Bacteroidia bacterium]|nr:MAG: hypothetical protein KatS3mg026_1285 [Bacteroidia bacterium]